MTSETALKTRLRPAVAPDGNGERCLKCREATVIRLDKKLGYFRLCAGCGHIEYLNRRFLRYDRHSRRWH